jgi:hypothetical protein
VYDRHSAAAISKELVTEFITSHLAAKKSLVSRGMSFSPRHLQVLDSAIATLCRARQILGWSYVFSFFALDRNDGQANGSGWLKRRKVPAPVLSVNGLAAEWGNRVAP